MKNDCVERLRKFKKSQKWWTYQKLATAMGVHARTVEGWFIEKYKPSPMALEKIEVFLARQAAIQSLKKKLGCAEIPKTGKMKWDFEEEGAEETWELAEKLSRRYCGSDPLESAAIHWLLNDWLWKLKSKNRE